MKMTNEEYDEMENEETNEENRAKEGPPEPAREKHGKKDASDAEMKAVDFQVALVLSRYGFGAMYTAKHLLRSRGMVQSWKKMGERHNLAKRGFSDDKVTKRLWKIRRVTTFKDLDFHLAKKLFGFNLSSSYIARKLEIPVSTVNSWRKGNSPASVREGFVDMELVDSKFEALLEIIKRDLTAENMDYFLTLKIGQEARNLRGDAEARGIGARTISQILRDFLHIEPIPERTVSSWIKGERRPHNLELKLVDEGFIEERFKELVMELTKKHINYHLAKALEAKGWNYSAIALFLGLDKEKLRGWIKKDRGSPVAKAFVNQVYVQRVMKTMITSAYGTEAAMTCEVPAMAAPDRRERKENAPQNVA
jgi:DNA-binding transcriptional regulator YiaG